MCITLWASTVIEGRIGSAERSTDGETVGNGETFVEDVVTKDSREVDEVIDEHFRTSCAACERRSAAEVVRCRGGGSPFVTGRLNENTIFVVDFAVADVRDGAMSDKTVTEEILGGEFIETGRTTRSVDGAS